MTQYLIDTNIFICACRKDKLASKYLDEIENQASISYIGIGELLQGVRNQSQLNQIIDLTSTFDVIWGSPKIEQNAITILTKTINRGISLFDALMAATAIEHNLTLVTLNLKHFQSINNLKVSLPPYIND